MFPRFICLLVVVSPFVEGGGWITVAKTAYSCMGTHGVTTSEIQLLTNPEAQVPPKVYCFLQCFGNGAGFIQNGAVQTHRLKELPFMPSVSNDISMKVTQCLDNVGTIGSCEDMIKVKTCLDEFFKQR